MLDVCFRMNSPSVIYERFGDEVVAIHLDTGVYHSLYRRCIRCVRIAF